MPRKRAKSLSNESVGTHQVISPLHSKSKNEPCLSNEVTRDTDSIDICVLNDNYLNEITSKANREIEQTGFTIIPDR